MLDGGDERFGVESEREGLDYSTRVEVPDELASLGRKHPGTLDSGSVEVHSVQGDFDLVRWLEVPHDGQGDRVPACTTSAFCNICFCDPDLHDSSRINLQE